MKYAHLSDLHIGAWREPKLRELGTQAFLVAMDRCEQEKVDFILFSGDLFDTALPAIDKLSIVAGRVRELKEKGIPVYVVPGSHDASASGKTMIDVLENAGLFVNVCKGTVVDGKLRLQFTVDARTGAKITGMLGKKGMLDHIYYEDLDREFLEKEDGYKIFMFHTALSELKPKHLENMETFPVSLLPKGFAYYAGGHVHHRMEYSAEGYKHVTQPGALFPTDFGEMEKYGHGGFYIIDTEVRWVPVKLKERVALTIDCEGKTPEEIVKMVDCDAQDSIVTLRFSGKVKGKFSDIRFNDIVQKLNAFHVLRNTSGLVSEEFEEVKIKEESIDEIEDALIKEHVQQVKIMDRDNEIMLTKELIAVLSAEKQDGETSHDFEKRVGEGAVKVLRLD